MNDAPTRNTSAGLVLAFVAGAVSGAIVALLTAPRSGRETRGRLKDLVREAAGRAARVPASMDAYSRAARAARQAFSEALEPQSREPDAPPGRPGH